MTNRWRPEAKLAERLYRDARPYLLSLSNSRTQGSTPDGLVREALAAGEWAAAVADMLHFGWRPDDPTREEIRRIWAAGRDDSVSSPVAAGLRFLA
jgi:hypothetical protein